MRNLYLNHYDLILILIIKHFLIFFHQIIIVIFYYHWLLFRHFQVLFLHQSHHYYLMKYDYLKLFLVSWPWNVHKCLITSLKNLIFFIVIIILFLLLPFSFSLIPIFLFFSWFQSIPYLFFSNKIKPPLIISLLLT